MKKKILLAFLLSFNLQAANDFIYGITVDDVAQLSDVKNSIGSLPRKMTTRIVFDENVKASYYTNAINTLSPLTFIMGEVLDSYYVKSTSTSTYLNRTKEYLDAFGDKVSIWEVGNEINGIWLGSASSVMEKVYGAYKLTKERGYKTAITLYYNGTYNNGVGHATDNCWSQPSEHMMTWAKANIPQDMKDNIDYVFVSYYENDCNNYKPNWQNVFDELGSVFPNALLGIGEAGSKDNNEKQTGQEESFLTYYYQDLVINHPRYVKGIFWWYFNRDMVPMTKPLWSYFHDLLAGDDGVPNPTPTPLPPPTPESYTLHPSSIDIKKGRMSNDQSIKVLTLQDQEGSEDNWDKYIQFFESTFRGFRGIFNFTLSQDFILAGKTSLTLKVNSMSAKKAHQKWIYKIKNFQSGKWVFLGDNQEQLDWQWSQLSFTLSNINAANFVDAQGKILIRLESPFSLYQENLQLDYMGLEI